jgi:hypothetical protein
VADFPTWPPDQVGKWIAAGVAVAIMASINLPITLIIFVPLLGIMVSLNCLEAPVGLLAAGG